MLPSWMQKTLSPNSTSTLPSKAQLLQQALSGMKFEYKDPRDRSAKVYDSISDSAKAFASSVNSILGSASDALPGENDTFFRSNASYLNSNVSEARKRELEKQASERAAISDSDYFGRAALAAKQYLRNPLNSAAEATGNILPFAVAAPAMIAAGAPTAATTVGLGAVLGAGAVKGGIYDQVMSTPDKDLMSDPTYASMRALGATEEGAKKQLANKLGSYGENGARIALGAIVGGLAGKLGADAAIAETLAGKAKDVSRAALRELAGESMLKSAAKGAAKEVFTEGPQESLETYLSNTGAAKGGASIDPGQGVVEAGVQAGLMSLVPGLASGPGEIASARSELGINEQELRDYKKRRDAGIQAANTERTGGVESLIPASPAVTEPEASPIIQTNPEPAAITGGPETASITGEPAVQEVRPAVLVPEAKSPRPEVADGDEAIVYNGAMRGITPYNSLVAAGYPPTKETVKLGTKLGKTVGNLARQAKKNAAVVAPEGMEGLGIDPRVMAQIKDAKAKLEAEKSNPAAIQPIEPLPALTQRDEEANAILDDIEAANPEVAPYQPITTDKSQIWRPEVNPVADQSMVPDQLELVDESAPKLELVDEGNPLENIPNQSAIAKAPSPDTEEYAANAMAGTEDANRQEIQNRPDQFDSFVDSAIAEDAKKLEDRRSEIKPQPIIYSYNGEPVEVTPEQKRQLDALDAHSDSMKQMYSKLDPDTRAKRTKGLGMEISAQKRQILGKLTATEQAKQDKRMAGNYIGKPVEVNGKRGKIAANPFGKVSVVFDDGTKAVVNPEHVKPVPVPKAMVPSNLASTKAPDNSISSRIRENYNGINPEQRAENYNKSESGAEPIVNGNGMIVYDPDRDTHQFVIKQLSRQTVLAKRLRNTLIRVSQIAGVTTAKFNGLSASGWFLGVNNTTSPNGSIYINPLLIAREAGFNAMKTAEGMMQTIVHELAHEVADPEGHSPEIFGKEMKRIIEAIGPAIMHELQNSIARDLNMDELRAMVQAQQPKWDMAWENGKFAVAKEIEAEAKNYKKVSLGGKIGTNETKQDGRTPSGGVPEAGGNGNSNRPVESKVHDSGSRQSGNTGEGKVSGPSVKEAKGMAARPDSGAGNGASRSEPSESQPIEKNSFELPQWKWWHDLTETWLNRFNRIDQVKSSLGNYARALTPMAAERIKALDATMVKPLEKLLGENNGRLEDLDRYARAMQAKVRNQTVRERGYRGDDGASISDEDAAKVIEKFKNDKVIKKAHEMLMAIAAHQRSILTGSGLVSQKEMELAQKSMGPYYVPLHSDEVDTGLSRHVGGIQVSGKDLRMAKGGNGPVKNVVAALIEQTNRSIVRAQHNAFMKDLASFVESNPSDIWEIDKHKAPTERVVEYHDDGEIRKIYIKDKVLLNQIRGMKPTELASFVNGMRSFTHLYSKLSTKWNPIFPMTNFIRDTPLGISRVFTNEGAGAAKEVMKGMPSALKASWTFRKDRARSVDKMNHMEQRAQQLLMAGGVPSWQGMEDADTIKSNIEKNVAAMSKKHGPKNIAMKAAAGLGEAFTIGNEAIETGIRLSYFDYLMNQKTKELGRNPSTKETIEIASKVRALTGDFQAQGTASRYMGAFYPFFNASVQGVRSVAELAIKAGKGDKKALAVFGTLAALGMAEDLLNSSVGGDDDDDGISNYDSMPDWMRRQKYIIPTVDGKSVIIPMTYGLSIAVNAGKLMSRAARGAIKPGDFAREMALAVNESSNPLGGGGSLTQMVSPLATDWMVQIAENKDWRGNKLFPDRYPGQEWKPNSEITAKKDSELAKAIAKMVNELGGGSETEIGAFGEYTPYPGAIDATAKWLAGGVGRLGIDTAGLIKDIVTGDDIDRIPGVSSFMTSPDKYFYTGRFYDQLNQLKQIKSMASGMKANARREELIAKHPEQRKVIEAMNAGDLTDALPTIANNEELKKNFARIGVKRLALTKMYDAAAKKIKHMEELDVPDKNEKILEIVKDLNKRFVEAGK